MDPRFRGDDTSVDFSHSLRDWERDEKNAFVLYVPTYFDSMTIDDSFKPSDLASNVMRPAFSVD